MKTRNLNVLYFSTMPPRECGIATFTRDLSTAVHKTDASTAFFHIALADRENFYEYHPENKVALEINQFILDDYKKAADYANTCGADVVVVQHEFGIFGGFDGMYLLDFLKNVKVPKVITWHTVPILSESKRRIRRIPLMRQIANLCDANVSITESSREFIIKQKISSAGKSFYIPHGSPEFDLSAIRENKRKLGLSQKIVLGSQGFISENKGQEFVILALPEIVKKYKNVIYLIIGTTHPLNPVAYRDYLKKIVRRLKLEKHVKFIDRYLPLDEVVEYISAVDIAITPYLVPEQISSGVLAYSVAAGKYNISTPFVYAKEVLADGRGKLVPFKDPKAIAKAVLEALRNPQLMKKVSAKAYDYGRNFLWSSVAEKYLDLFEKFSKR